MKRPKFQISINGQPVLVKSAWNTARKAMPGLVRDHIAHGSAEMIHKETTRLDPWHFKSGRFTWLDSDGAEILVEIELLEIP